ncbi:hypothetical protein ABE096_23130 [Robertmurraya massiliosenegalensis]|uniref:hypothetical protein n=1 Tax=Robertmurraya TaxID=2837507 RepID=UPI0039A4D685
MARSAIIVQTHAIIAKSCAIIRGSPAINGKFRAIKPKTPAITFQPTRNTLSVGYLLWMARSAIIVQTHAIITKTCAIIRGSPAINGKFRAINPKTPAIPVQPTRNTLAVGYLLRMARSAIIVETHAIITITCAIIRGSPAINGKFRAIKPKTPAIPHPTNPHTEKNSRSFPQLRLFL